MKLFAVLAIIVALYFLYRLAFPKKSIEPSKSTPQPPQNDNVMGKSTVVLRQMQTNADTRGQISKPVENPDTFAQKNENEAEENAPMNIDVPTEYKNEGAETESEEPENNEVDADEEAEELRQTLGSDAELATGCSYEEMDTAVSEVNHPTGENEAQAAETLYRLENTECVTQLAAISPEKASRIKDLITLHVQSIEPTVENNSDTDDFDIAQFLS